MSSALGFFRNQRAFFILQNLIKQQEDYNNETDFKVYKTVLETIYTNMHPDYRRCGRGFIYPHINCTNDE